MIESTVYFGDGNYLEVWHWEKNTDDMSEWQCFSYVDGELYCWGDADSRVQAIENCMNMQYEPECD